jgi:hypothetical protein
MLSPLSSGEGKIVGQHPAHNWRRGCAPTLANMLEQTGDGHLGGISRRKRDEPGMISVLPG